MKRSQARTSLGGHDNGIIDDGDPQLNMLYTILTHEEIWGYCELVVTNVSPCVATQRTDNQSSAKHCLKGCLHKSNAKLAKQTKRVHILEDRIQMTPLTITENYDLKSTTPFIPTLAKE